jgi:hypothetical protein
MSARHQWTEEEDRLLRNLMHYTSPGGLNLNNPPLGFKEIAAFMNKEALARDISRRVYTKESVYDRYYKYIRPVFSTPNETAARELKNVYIASESAEKAAVRSIRSNSLETDLAKQAQIAADMAQEGAGMATEIVARAAEVASQAASQAAKEAKYALLAAAERAEMAIMRAKMATDEAMESTE